MIVDRSVNCGEFLQTSHTPETKHGTFHYEDHDQLRTHLANFMAAYNFARRLKTPSGLVPYEYICKVRTSGPDRLILDPIRQMP